MSPAEPGARLGDITWVVMWESELRGDGRLPMVCAVTGEDAVGWDTFDCYVDPDRTDVDDEKFEGLLPVCALVRRRVGIVITYSAVSLLFFLLTIIGIVLQRWIGPIPAEAAGATTVAMWLTILVVKELARKGLPEPGGAIRGAVDGERWALVEPVHPHFAVAIANLPRPRPSFQRPADR